MLCEATCSECGFLLRALFDAKPKFKTFLHGAISGKVAPVRMAAEQKKSTVFIPCAEDDEMPVVPSKRSGPGGKAGKKRQKHS